MNLSYPLIGITILFFFLVMLKELFPPKTKEKICAICIATSITWIFLLILYHSKKFNNIVLISLLSGMTLLGIFYLFEKKIKKRLTFFRLPFLLTLILIGYFALTLENILQETGFLGILWLIFWTIYSYRENPRFKKMVNKVVDCCKKW